MAVRLIAGRAGSGKTHHCLTEVCRELTTSRSDGPRLVLLVPEQAGLQVERAILSMLETPALGRCEVLSFRRLAHRILSETIGPSPMPLTATGRQMALRYLIGRNKRRLREFGKVADRTGFLAAVSRTIVELLQEAVTPDQLEQAAGAAESEGDPSAPRLGDMAFLYRAYLDYLGVERVDPEAVLDLARARLKQLAWPDGARIWIDGFAGLTQQQVRMIAALAQRASSLDVALLLDPELARLQDFSEPPDDLSLFARTERTWYALGHALREAGIGINSPRIFQNPTPPRFERCPVLAALERRLFQPALRSGDNEVASEAQQGRPEAVHLIRAADRREEVELAVTALTDLTCRAEHPLRFRDIAIVVRDLRQYHDLIAAALAARDTPYFIDRRRPTFHHPLVQLVRALLAMQTDSAVDQNIIAMLKTGLTGLTDEQAQQLENYVLAHGMVSWELWQEEWAYPFLPSRPESSKTPYGQAVLSAVNSSRAFVIERLSGWWVDPRPKGLSQVTEDGPRQSSREWVQAVGTTLERLQARAILERWCEDASARGDLDEAEEHQQVWVDLARLLDEAAEALQNEPISGRQFREVVESALADFTVGLVPATLDQVLVSSIERSRHPPVRAVFVLGFSEGEFPSRAGEDAVLSDEDRARLDRCGVKLAQTRVRQLLDERMLAYIAFTRPSEFLWVSYPQADEAGKPVAPSPYWQQLRAALPTVTVLDGGDWPARGQAWPARAAAISSVRVLAASVAGAMRAWCEDRLSDAAAAAYWMALYDWAGREGRLRPIVAAALSALHRPEGAVLTKQAMDALWRPPHRVSVTALEQFARCPFRHFAGYGLRLEPRAVHEISNIDMGRMYHTILEQFVNELNETERTLRDVSPAEIAEHLSRLCRHVVPRYAEELRMDPAQQRGLVWRSERELPAASLGQQAALRNTPLKQAGTEVGFGDGRQESLPALQLKLDDGKVVELRGKIDRIDLLQAGDERLALVFDYKRSFGKSLRLEEVYHGLALQLLAYLLVLREHGKSLAGSRMVPGGAFYLPLLAPYERVDHPSEAQADDFDALGAFRPRGVLDFDWIDALDPAMGQGRSRAFAAYRGKDGKPGHLNTTDVVPDGKLPLLLDYVRDRLRALATRWLAGDISVTPIVLGTYSPCTDCLYRSVCRVDHVTRLANRKERMSRSDVLDAVSRPREAGKRSS